MAKVRSPVLGFNHNIRHKGWLFHVQTEDSGIQNPHLFTHLFHDGVILATKKMVYDANADVEIVKALMQSQHKSVLRELKGGIYDEKIRQYLGEDPAEAATTTPMPGDEEQEAEAVIADAGAEPLGGEAAEPPTAADVSAAFRALSEPHPAQSPPTPEPEPEAVPEPASSENTANLVFRAPPSAPPPPGKTSWVSARPGVQERPFAKSGSFPALVLPTDTPAPPDPAPAPGRGALPEVPGPPPPSARKPKTVPPAPNPPAPPASAATAPTMRAVPKPPPPPRQTTPPPAAPARETRPPGPARPVAPPAGAAPPTAPPRPRQGDNVIVARPAVIIGAPPQVVGGGAPAVQPRRPGGVARESTPPPESIFGQDLISEKSLDEVIMAYLSEDANDE